MIEKLRDIRRSRGLTQQQLAKQAGVSQSLIARIEKGQLDPAYSKATKIISALRQETTKTAEQIMTRNVRKIKPSTTIKRAANIMKKYSISQLPVFEKHTIGTISERAIAYALVENPNAKLVSDIMEPTMPIVNAKTHINLISSILEYEPAVLVMKKGRLCGIITRANLLGLVG
jgi:predicted transcriptional regulator